MQQVKCQDCGYLSARRGTTPPDLEVSPEFRTSGGRPDATIHTAPFCHVGANDLVAEYESCVQGAGDKKRVRLDVITRERVCGRFVPYQPGKSPAEHRQSSEAATATQGQHMHEYELLKYQLDRLERQADRQADAQLARDREYREWVVQQAKAQRDWQDRMESDRKAEKADDERKAKEKDDKAADREWWRWVLTGLAVGAMALIQFFGSRHYNDLDRKAEEDRKPAVVQPK